MFGFILQQQVHYIWKLLKRCADAIATSPDWDGAQTGGMMLPPPALPILVNMNRRSVDVGMTLRAQEDKVSTKARVNWLLRQVKADNLDDLFLRLLWLGKSELIQNLVFELKEQPEIAETERTHLSPHSFH